MFFCSLVNSDTQFSTKDNDNDYLSGSCAYKFKGSWWYRKCHLSNLNGLYQRGPHDSFADGINWVTFKGYYYSLRRSEMKSKALSQNWLMYPRFNWDFLYSDGLLSHPGRVEVVLVASCFWKRDKLRSDGPLGSYADFSYLTSVCAVWKLSHVVSPLFVIVCILGRYCFLSFVAFFSRHLCLEPFNLSFGQRSCLLLIFRRGSFAVLQKYNELKN